MRKSGFSSASVCLWHQVLYIQAFVLVFLLGKFMRKVFFGQLRAAEMEVGFFTLLIHPNVHSSFEFNA